jgi:hypothetical protein
VESETFGFHNGESLKVMTTGYAKIQTHKAVTNISIVRIRSSNSWILTYTRSAARSLKVMEENFEAEKAANLLVSHSGILGQRYDEG